MSRQLFSAQKRYYIAAIPLQDQTRLLVDAATRISEELVKLCPSLRDKIKVQPDNDVHLTLIEPVAQDLDEDEQPWRSQIDAIAKSYPELKCSPDDPWVMHSEPTLCVSIDPSSGHVRTLRYQLKPTDRFLNLRKMLYNELYPESKQPSLDDTTGLHRLSAGGHITLMKLTRLTQDENDCVIKALGLVRSSSKSSTPPDMKTEEGTPDDASTASSTRVIDINVHFSPDSPLLDIKPERFMPTLKLGLVHIRTSTTPRRIDPSATSTSTE